MTRSALSRRRLVASSIALAGGSLLDGCAPGSGSVSSGIYQVAADGGEPVLVVLDAARPVPSPDGSRIAWASERGVFAARSDGSGIVQLSESEQAGPPSWSSDGLQLAWTDAAARSITFAGADGWEQRSYPMVAPGLDRGLVALPLRNQPSWSPDGSAVAFVSWDGSGDEVYRIGTDGSDRRRLSNLAASRESVNGNPDEPQTKAFADAARPAWSPVGRRVAFAVAPEVAGAAGGVFSVDAQGERQRRLSSQLAGFGPLWSPDGTAFAIVQHASEGGDLIVYGIETRQPRNLTAGAGLPVLDAAWSPDGECIAYSANGAIYVVDIRSRAISLVVDTALDDRSPAWTPDGSSILFMAAVDLFQQSSMPDIP